VGVGQDFGIKTPVREASLHVVRKSGGPDSAPRGWQSDPGSTDLPPETRPEGNDGPPPRSGVMVSQEPDLKPAATVLEQVKPKAAGEKD